VPQQQTVQANSIGANGTTTATYTGPVSIQGERSIPPAPRSREHLTQSRSGRALESHATEIPCRGMVSLVENWEAEDGVQGYTADKDVYLARLRRIEGQVRGLQRMIEGDQYCIDILTQVSAVTKALQSVALGLMEDHLGHCVAQATAEGGEIAAAKVREASEAIARLVRS
jgi:CsoR family transcriptional regulator, copper-sensing transcriptional repressor